LEPRPHAGAPDPATAPVDDARAWVERAFKLLNPDTAAAHELATRARDAAEPASVTLGRAYHAVGMSAAMLGKTDLAREQLRIGSEILSGFGDIAAACGVWRDYGSVLAFVIGDLHAGLAALEQALAVARRLDDKHEEGMCLARLGSVLGHAGRRDESLEQLERAVALLADSPHSEAYAGALSNLGHSHLLAENYELAASLLRKERALHNVDDARLRVANCNTNLATALAGIGEIDEARMLLAEAGSLLNPETDGHQWVDYLLASGRVALFADDPEGACGPLQKGIEAACAGGMHRIEIELHSALAQAQESSGQLAAALASERARREAERAWLDEQAAAQLQKLESDLELLRERTEREALEKAHAKLEERVQERTAELQVQMREREAAQEMARFWADHDWLTRLPNRRQLKAALETMLAEATATGMQLGVLFVDLDGFKEINDSHGHLSGDHLLCATARRLEQESTPGAIITRFGGDEFVVLLPNLATPAQVLAAAQTLRNAVLAPLDLDGRSVCLSCSIGVAVSPRDGHSPEALLRRADQAMLEAKTAGRNRVFELDQIGQARLDRRSWIKRELEAAIHDGRLFPAFQPLWNARRGECFGVELLARLEDPELGPISPGEFIPLAEETGLITRLGVWAVAQASAAVRALRDSPGSSIPDDFRIAVNLSTVQLATPTLVDDLRAAVDDAGGKPQWIQLELTESRRLAEDAAIQQRLRDLKALGFTLAIDDFGAGYSSFSYLNSDFFDRLKIDRSLLEAASKTPARAAVIGSIVAMARHLGLDVVGEGVETEQQLQLLAAEGCDNVQGFHIARPMPLESLLKWAGPA
jgi:diguanylate cyclase (GGDEF)-like protein